MVNIVEWKQLGVFCFSFFLLFKCSCFYTTSLGWEIERNFCDKQVKADCALFTVVMENITIKALFSPNIFFSKLLSIYILCSPQCMMTELQFDLEPYHMCKPCLTLVCWMPLYFIVNSAYFVDSVSTFFECFDQKS